MGGSKLLVVGGMCNQGAASIATWLCLLPPAPARAAPAGAGSSRGPQQQHGGRLVFQFTSEPMPPLDPARDATCIRESRSCHDCRHRFPL